jgi:hypothetical protein
MNIFKNLTPESLLKEVENFSKTLLLNKNDLLLVFTEGLKTENLESFNNLLFTTKYVQGLKRVLDKGASLPDVNNLDDVKKDLSENFISVIEILKVFNKTMPDENKEKFKYDYLKMNQDCLSNLNCLLEGLEWTKIYLNDLKRE